MRLGVTRDQAQLGELSEQGRAKGIDVVPVPLINIEAVAFDWPSEFNIAGPDWLFISSPSGARSFFERLRALGRELPLSTRIAAVGEKTAAALVRYGRHAGFVPSEPYGELLFTEFLEKAHKPGETVLYARAQDVNFDPAELFAERGVEYTSVTCYRTSSQKVSPELVEQFTQEDYLLFTAPSTVRSYHEQFGAPRARVVALGRSTGSEMIRHGWTGIAWLPTPNLSYILEYLS